ncbi:hypothetical protein [Streptomonospora alba]|nr:hypothetical protein [Streptomonospora alba]
MDLMDARPLLSAAQVQVRDSAIVDHGINVDEIPEPYRLAERAW